MAKRDIRSLTPSALRPSSYRSLLQHAQDTFYRESCAALQDLRNAYIEEVRLHTQLLRQKGLTFEKDEQTQWKKEDELQQARLDGLYGQVKKQTEGLQVSVDPEKVLRLEEEYAEVHEELAKSVMMLCSPLAEAADESLTYSKDSTPTATPKPQLLFFSPSEAMAARLQEMNRKDREARQQAMSANHKWLGNH